MSNLAYNLLGKRLGIVTVVERLENDRSRRSRWKVRCDQGHEWTTLAYNLFRRPPMTHHSCATAMGRAKKRADLEWLARREP
jgi:hypothetical protein